MAAAHEKRVWSDLQSAAGALMRAYGTARAKGGPDAVGEDPIGWAQRAAPDRLEALLSARDAYREVRPHWDPHPAEIPVAGARDLTLRPNEERPGKDVLDALSHWAAGTVHGSAAKVIRKVGRIRKGLEVATAERLVAIAAGEQAPGPLSTASEQDARAWAAEVVARQMAWRFSGERLRDAIRRIPNPPDKLGLEMVRRDSRTDDDFRLLAETFTSFEVRREIVRFPEARADERVRAPLGETARPAILKQLLWTDDVPPAERRRYFRRAATHHPEDAVRWLETAEIEADGLRPEDLLGPLGSADAELRQRAMFAAAELGEPIRDGADADRPARTGR